MPDPIAGWSRGMASSFSRSVENSGIQGDRGPESSPPHERILHLLNVSPIDLPRKGLPCVAHTEPGKDCPADHRKGGWDEPVSPECESDADRDVDESANEHPARYASSSDGASRPCVHSVAFPSSLAASERSAIRCTGMLGSVLLPSGGHSFNRRGDDTSRLVAHHTSRGRVGTIQRCLLLAEWLPAGIQCRFAAITLCSGHHGSLTRVGAACPTAVPWRADPNGSAAASGHAMRRYASGERRRRHCSTPGRTVARRSPCHQPRS